MTDFPEIQAHPTDQPVQCPEIGRALKFGKNNGFHVELRRRVDAFFERTGLRQRDCPQMYVKTAILLANFAASYTLLVFVAQT
jgi:linoleoyl-CoA desaturase